MRASSTDCAATYKIALGTLRRVPASDTNNEFAAGTTGRRAQIVGIGLIGGSVASALRKVGWFVTGRDIEPGREKQALEMGIIDTIGTDTTAALSVVAVPASNLIGEVKRALADTEQSRGIVTDTGSVKAMVAAAIDHPRFVPGHPMAGSEQDGLEGADSDMFQGAVWTLAPSEHTDDAALQALQTVLSSLGSDVVTLTPERHDVLVAVVSHVPHLTAALLMCLADDKAQDHAPLQRLAAGGFRDMTRIAAGSPEIWLDICAENKQAITDVLDELATRFAQLRQVIESTDKSGLRDVLSQARHARTNLPSRYVRPQELQEVRVPMPDRKGQIAAITILAADCNINVADIEVAHSTEGERGVLVMVVAREDVEGFLNALTKQGYHPTTRELV